MEEFINYLSKHKEVFDKTKEELLKRMTQLEKEKNELKAQY